MKSKKRFGLLVALCLTIVMLIGLTVFASPVSAQEQNGWILNDGKWYYYEAGARYDDGIYWVGDNLYYFDADGVMADHEWVLYDENWFYAKAGGALCSSEIYNIGGTLYAFDGGCVMYDNAAGIVMKETEDGWEELYVYAKAGGALYANEWLLLEDEWYYAKADGTMCRDEIYNIGGVLYGFDERARMYDDEGFVLWHEDGDGGYETYHGAKPGGALYVNEWYLYEDPESEYTAWYYYDEKGEAPHGYKVVGGVPYLFWYGEMMDGPGFQTDGEDNLYFIAAGGKATFINANGWTKLGSKWIYSVDGEMYEEGVYKIDGTYYAFEGGFMVDDDFYYADYTQEYCAQAGGALYRNSWYYDGHDWYYYGDDCMAYYDGVYNIGGVWYMFRYGYMETNWDGSYEDGYYYVVDEDGNLTYTRNGWLKDTENEWMWIVDGEREYLDGLYEIDEVCYLFRDGYLAPNSWRYADELEGFVASNDDGTWRKQPGWYAIEGKYVYVDENGVLLQDWQVVDGAWYLFDPCMSYGTLQLDWSGDSVRFYAFNAAGQYAEVTTDGMYVDEDGDLVLIENGKVVEYEWRQIDGKWYYFGNGYARNGFCWIDDAYYYFDESRQLVANGWYQWDAGMWLYADESGALYTDGIYEIGGTEYQFNYEGRLITDDMWVENDELVVIDGSGAITRYPLVEGWNNINGKMYYYEFGDLVYGYYTVDDDLYYFEYDSLTMLTDEIYDGRYFGADGRAMTGWIRMADGAWMYADENGDLCDFGVYEIGENEYLFLDYELVVDQTVELWGMIYTTDANGVIVDSEYVDYQMKDGWNYLTDGNYGQYGTALYYQDGMPYTGWLGDCYIEDGEMVRLTVEDIGGKLYIFGEDGHLLRNEWMEIPFGYEGIKAYVYGDANGYPFDEQWLQSGGKWYYFREYTTLFDGVYEIDGVEHVFDENSAWQGEYKEDTLTDLKDGWNYINGNWYYGMAGEPVYGEVYDGVWYFCDEDGMVTNGFGGYGPFCYYDASGVRAEYVGWHKIDGRWVYFNTNHTVAIGWLNLDGTCYYIDVDEEYDFDNYYVEIGMATGYRVIDGRIYHFDASGAYTGTVTTDGWFYDGADWYYLEDGYIYRDDVYEIGGVWYAFDYEGKMMTDCVYYGMAFGASGAAVENGWVLIDGTWQYVKGGELCSGVHLIDGVVYYFLPMYGY